MIDDNRAIFMFKDGAQAWEAKDFLVTQERCESVTIENKVYPGEHSTKNSEEETENSSDDDSKSTTRDEL